MLGRLVETSLWARALHLSGKIAFAAVLTHLLERWQAEEGVYL